MADFAERANGHPPPWLSVLVPVYNEAGTVDALLRRLHEAPYRDKEVIVVDDGSQDATRQILTRWAAVPGFVVLTHARNQGKGTAIRTALAQAQGDIVVIQDADLEYDPADLPRLIELIRRGESDVVYGSRYLQREQPLDWSKFRLAVILLNLVVRLLYGQRLSDEATCYKAFRTALLRRLQLRARRFEFCAEVTAKLCRLGIPIREVPISYRPRTAAEGKKIGWRDAWQTLWTLLRWRLVPLSHWQPTHGWPVLHPVTAVPTGGPATVPCLHGPPSA